MSRRIFLIQSLALPFVACTIAPLPRVQSFSVAPPANPKYRQAMLGQSWQYKKLNQYNSQVMDVITDQVTQISQQQVTISRTSGQGNDLGQEIQLPWGQVIRDCDWDYVQGYQNPIPWVLGVSGQNLSTGIQTTYQVNNSSYVLPIQISMQQIGWERVIVPAGTFDTIRVERFIRFQHNDKTRLDPIRTDQYWFSPELGRWVIRETNGRYLTVSGSRRIDYREDYLRYELQKWS
jgi:hypothetical protein